MEFADSRTVGEHTAIRPHQRDGDPAILDLMVQQLERTKSMPSFPSSRNSLKHWTAFCEREDLVYVSEITLAAQEAFAASRRRELLAQGWTASNASINRDFALLSVALRQAWKRGQIAAVPYVMRLQNPPPTDRFLTAEQSRRLLAACDQKYVFRFVLLGLHTLQRPKAIFGLRVEQVDLVNGRIDFLPRGSVQTNKRRPVVPITESLRTELELAVKESKTGHIIEKDGLPLQSMRKAFRRAATRADLPRDTTPYILRHTGATLLSQAGVPMQQIASMLGHTTQRTTEIYAKRRPEFLMEAADTLDELFKNQVAHPSPAAPSVSPRVPGVCHGRLMPSLARGGAVARKRRATADWRMVPLTGIEPATPSLRIEETRTSPPFEDNED